jgi:hypothetical protein
MNDQQYGMMVIMLSSAGQLPGAFAQLDAAMLENIIFLLGEAKKAAEQERDHRAALERK